MLNDSLANVEADADTFLILLAGSPNFAKLLENRVHLIWGDSLARVYHVNL